MFSLHFHIPPSEHKVQLKDSVITMGSCFSEEIGKKFREYKFHVLSNPFGVIYNPHSIFKHLRLALTNGLDQRQLIRQDGIYYHWDAHSLLSAATEKELLLSLDHKTEETRKLLLKAKWLVISLGTSHVYRYKKNSEIVANCHRVPQREFEKSILSPSEIVGDFLQTLKILNTANPKLKILFTVSPVRHIKDGLIENNLSKGILIQAIQELVKLEENVHYFPAYELMIDVLRDYRFFKEDMVHPNTQAIEYIWEQFTTTYMNNDTLVFIEQWKAILKSMNHTAFHPHSLAHQSFIRSTIKTLKKLEDKIDISTELKILENQLIV